MEIEFRRQNSSVVAFVVKPFYHSDPKYKDVCTITLNTNSLYISGQLGIKYRRRQDVRL